MVTLAYIRSLTWLLHEVQGPLANGSAQKYYCCVDRADNTCAVSILAVIAAHTQTERGARHEDQQNVFVRTTAMKQSKPLYLYQNFNITPEIK